MKHALYIGILLLCLCSCKDKANTFVLEGHVSSLVHDTIYIYGADALHERIDTIISQDGAFSYTTSIDTVVPMWILFPNMQRKMVFANKGETVTLYGDTTIAERIHLNGGEPNILLHTFHERTKGLQHKETVAVADSFIRNNPYSEVSIHLLREYFVEVPNPDYTRVKTLIGSMSGNLQDNNYIRQLQHSLNERRPLVKNSIISNYNVNDTEGKNVSTSDYKDTCLLVTFWASWDEESRMCQRELIATKEKYKEYNFDILSVSLDTDRKAWLQAIAEDSLTWRQANDFAGWETGFVQRMQIDHLPANVLFTPQRRIHAMNIYGDKLEKEIEALTTKVKVENRTKKKNPHNIRERKSLSSPKKPLL